MAKKIDWLEKFANDQYKQMTKTASYKKIANQIIVDRSAYPNAKVGSLVDYDNGKYKIVDTKYRDKSGPGLLLEEVTAELDAPTCNGEIKPTNGTIPATSTSEANCGDFCQSQTKSAHRIINKIAAKEDDIDDDFADLDFDTDTDLDFDADDDDGDTDFSSDMDDDISTDTDDKDFDVLSDFDDSKVDTQDNLLSGPEESEYPPIITRPGGVKPAPSAPIEGPGKKHVTDPPYHPTFDPGEQYALESLDEWQDAADRTAKAIEQEDSQDRTTVEGHYTWNQYIDAILDNDNVDDTGAISPAEDNSDIDEELPEDSDIDDDTDMSINDDDDINTDIDADVDADDDIEEDLDLDTDDADIDNDNDEVDDAVDSMLDDDIPEDFGEETSSTDDFEADDNDNDFDSDNDMDIPDEDNDSFDDNDFEDNNMDDEIEENKTVASNRSSARPLSRLAFKNK